MSPSPRAADPKKLLKGRTGEWEVIIGLEVHAQVTSNAKLFSGASASFGGEPNDHVSLVDAAMPGMLPVINRFCVEQAVRTGLGLEARINRHSVFDRKNYFYPDLPQGYQISQYKQPVVGEGRVSLDMPGGETVEVGIERLHLEQDAGKSIHDQNPSMSLVDLNRSGVALMEIVSKPDMRSSDEARAYVSKLRTILRYLGTCDGNMEQGSLRADVNVSVRRPGEPFGTRCEIKNVNSIRFMGQAIEYEARRQIDIIEDGGSIDQETRLFDARKGETRSMRSKEEAHDYRYFPDPDLLPLVLDEALIEGIKASLPELPDQKKRRFMKDFGLSAYDAGELVAEQDRASFFEEMVQHGSEPKRAANWVLNDILSRTKGWQASSATGAASASTYLPQVSSGPPTTLKYPTMGPTGPAANTQIVGHIASGTISVASGRLILDALFEDPTQKVEDIIEKQDLRQVSDEGAIEREVDAIVSANPDKATQARDKPALAGWFVGQVMKATGGKANPQAVGALVRKRLGLE